MRLNGAGMPLFRAGSKRRGAGAGRGGLVAVPRALLSLFVLASALLAACGREAVTGRTSEGGTSRGAGDSARQEYGGPTFSTWEKEGKAVNPAFTYPAPAESPRADFIPWTGTVSHHFLTDPLIDAWFKEIRKRREVRHFFILSPSHFGLSTRDYSVADGRWECAAGNFVYTNRELSSRLCAALGVDYDRQVFYDEHGVSTLIPYIRRYFPAADVIAVAIQGEPPVNMDYCRKLYKAVAPFFDAEGKQENFLIVSSDFSHHGTPEQTAFKDGISRTFFDHPTRENFIAAVCDNRPSVYVMSSLFGADVKAFVLFHTNSFTISGMDKDDITSYFFSLFE
ncbi:MAG: AmmeMemoRadiSam system protein B [Treponema sp.]|nr:AmmeMemoRadiSam system protein B [Treponema sp.]